jgi:hypothetical protein
VCAHHRSMLLVFAASNPSLVRDRCQCSLDKTVTSLPTFRNVPGHVIPRLASLLYVTVKTNQASQPLVLNPDSELLLRSPESEIEGSGYIPSYMSSLHPVLHVRHITNCSRQN